MFRGWDETRRSSFGSARQVSVGFLRLDFLDGRAGGGTVLGLFGAGDVVLFPSLERLLHDGFADAAGGGLGSGLGNGNGQRKWTTEMDND